MLQTHSFVRFAPTQDVGTPRGIYIVAHGLNVLPQRMDALCSQLTDWGYIVYRLDLYGHGAHFSPPLTSDMAEKEKKRARLKSFQEVTTQHWLEDLYTAWQQAHQEAQDNGSSVSFLGFSLGGLLGCVGLVHPEWDITFEKMILLAPAIALRWPSKLLYPLYPFPKLLLKSGSPAPYRSNSSTSIAAYRALDTLHRFVHKHASSKLNRPTLVLFAQHDELIHPGKLYQFKEMHQLNRWELHPLPRQQPEYRRSPHHLMIDSASVGRKCWDALIQRMDRHIHEGTQAEKT